MPFDLEMFAEWKRTEDKGLESKLIEDNDKLVRHQLAKICRLGGFRENEDRLQAGRIGLIIALRKYTPERGKFSTYAAHWIRDQVQKSRVKTDLEIKRPMGAGLPYHTIRKMEAIAARTGRPATAEELGVTQEHIDDYRCQAHVTICLDDQSAGNSESKGSEGDDRRHDHMQGVMVSDEALDPEESLEREEHMALLKPAMECLTPKEREIIMCIFFEGETQRRLTDRFKMSPNTLQEIRERALAKMRTVLER